MFTESGLLCWMMIDALGFTLDLLRVGRPGERRLKGGGLAHPGDELAEGHEPHLRLGESVVDEVGQRLATGLVVESGPAGVRRLVELRIDVGVPAQREGRA